MATTTTRETITSFYLHSTPKSSRGLLHLRQLSEAFAQQRKTAWTLFSDLNRKRFARPKRLISAQRGRKIKPFTPSHLGKIAIFHLRPGPSDVRRAKKAPSKFAENALRGEKGSTCAVSDAFENPQLYRGASDSVFGSHYIGWACKLRSRYRLPAGTPSVRQKDRPMHEHRRGFVRPLPAALMKSTTASSDVQGRRPVALVPRGRYAAL